MNIVKLSHIKHNYDFVDKCYDKCRKMIVSCNTTEQMESANQTLKFVFDYILKKEHFEEYTEFRLKICKMLDKNNDHESFFKYVEDKFKELNSLIKL